MFDHTGSPSAFGIWSEFPDLKDRVWKWADDEKTPKFPIQFLNDGTINWSKKKQGYWKLKNKKILEVQFHGNVHELRYHAEERKAVVMKSDKHPSGAIWGDSTLKYFTIAVLFLLRKIFTSFES